MTEEIEIPSVDTFVDGALLAESFAGAVAVTRHLYDQLGSSEPPLQTLIHVASGIARGANNLAYPSVVAFSSVGRDDAARAVQSAFLAVAVARALDDSPAVLAGIALAALLVDAGRARLARESSIDLEVFRELPDSLDLLCPAATAALGVQHSPSALCEAASLMAFEAAWLERPRLGRLHRGKLPPLLSSRILRACRALLERIAPRKNEDTATPLDALAHLARDLESDPAAFALLRNVIGSVPVGTVVELESGEWGVVGPEASCQPGQPVLHLVVDSKGQVAEQPELLDLDGIPVRIVRAIEARDVHFNVARALARA